MPSDSGSRRAASGGAFERRKIAAARKAITAATIHSVLRVRLFIKGRQKYPITPGGVDGYLSAFIALVLDRHGV